MLQIIIFILLFIIVIGVVLELGFRLIAIKKKKELSKQGKIIKEYFKKFDADHPLKIVDVTPRVAVIGNRHYVLRPLKYRQVTRLCIMFAQILEKLNKEQLDLNQADLIIGKLIELCEEDFFRGLAYILYYSKNEKENDDLKVAYGVDEVFNYLKDNATLEELTVCLEIIIMQNDIQRALESFGRLSLKKKV